MSKDNDQDDIDWMCATYGVTPEDAEDMIATVRDMFRNESYRALFDGLRPGDVLGGLRYSPTPENPYRWVREDWLN